MKPTACLAQPSCGCTSLIRPSKYASAMSPCLPVTAALAMFLPSAAAWTRKCTARRDYASILANKAIFATERPSDANALAQSHDHISASGCIQATEADLAQQSMECGLGALYMLPSSNSSQQSSHASQGHSQLPLHVITSVQE